MNSLLYRAGRAYLIGYSLACALFVLPLVGTVGQILFGLSVGIVGITWLKKRLKQFHTPVAQLVVQAAHNGSVVGSSPTGSTYSGVEQWLLTSLISLFRWVRFPSPRLSKKEENMSFFIISGILLITSISVVVYGLYKREEQNEMLQRRIATVQEKFINK